MKKLWRLLAFLLVSAMLFALVPATFTVSAASPLDGKKILFFGDSLTEKYYGGVNYVALLEDMFPNSTLVNKGVSGNSTYNARLRFDNDVIAQDPDIVFICLGMNDAAIDNASTGATVKPIATYRRNIQNFITALKAIDCEVVLMTPNPVCAATDWGRTSPDYVNGKHVEFCDVLRELAVENEIGLVDLYTEFEENGYVTASYIHDGLHQTAAGHQVFADKIAAYLNAVYNNTNKATLTVEYVTEGGKNIGSQTYVGANGAIRKILVPEIEGYTPVSADTVVTLETKTIQFTYSSMTEEVLSKVENMDRTEYAQRVLEEIDYYCDIAENSTDASELALAGNRLEYLITVKGETELIYTNYMAYTTSPAPNYFYNSGSDTRFVDDNVRLSDGIKSSDDGYNEKGSPYSVWYAVKPEITFDLGKTVTLDTVRAYVAEGPMGISRPDSITFSVSEDGSSFTTVKSTASSAMVSDGDWDTWCLTLTAEKAVEARYVKITLNTVTWGSKCVWVDEVEAVLADTDVIIEEETVEPPVDPGTGDEEPVVPPVEPEIIGLRGDVTKNNEIDSRDYVFLKRAYFGTYKLDETATLLADVNNSGGLDSRDYVFLKRAYFGTYKIPENLKYVYAE